ncbi:MAG: ABC transporter permease [Candidatus Coatesbacteria bacterium]|nr:ABC transporter permease [Candidatus Coatesbacteria bacterium]
MNISIILSLLYGLKEGARIAFDSILKNKLRSFLTVLGVVIGVGTIIAMVSLISGMDKSITSQIESFGLNVFFVTKWEPTLRLGGKRGRFDRSRPDFTIEDAEAIKKGCPSVAAVSPENHRFGTVVRYKNKRMESTRVIGIWTDYFIVQETKVAIGREFTPFDIKLGTQTCILGADTAKELLSDRDPLNEQITVNGQQLRVVGVTESRGTFMGQSQDDFILLPYGIYKRMFPDEIELEISCSAVNPEKMTEAIDEVTSLIRRKRKLKFWEPDNFAIVTQERILSQYRDISTAFYLVMLIISSIALIVGGVGVMNIMLMSVTERTMEIGVRKAIGAKNRSILFQFMVEAATLTSVGGIFGVLLGYGIAYLVNYLVKLPATVSPWSVIAGIVFSGGVGLFFGTWPAYKAAKLDPIEALRYE